MLDAFCLDTSVFINCWVKHYPPVVFPTLWKQIEDHIHHDRIWSCDSVFQELQRQKDELLAWAKQHKPIFKRPNAKTIARVTDVMAKFPNFAAKGGASNSADPWLIAEAISSRLVVVTYEEPAKWTPKPTKPPKIPDVCTALGISWATPSDLFYRLGIVV